MNFKELKNKIKEEQKQLAQKITIAKSYRKPSSRLNINKEHHDICFYKSYGTLYYDEYQEKRLGREYRHIHLAYCQFFNNTPYEKIENKTREDNSPNKKLINEYINEWKKSIDEALCDCA